jgi:uncharacterized protein with NAD-binding domain and iron-sulfur cluster
MSLKMSDKTVILRAGIAGIAAGYKLGNQAMIYEATEVLLKEIVIWK